MATFCLLPNKLEAFKKALKDKDIKISDLLNMSSEARTKLLEKYAGKNAKDVNALFEKKLVLKNKMLGLKNWASKVGEIGRYSPEKKAEMARMLEDYKKMQQERIFSPKENETFLNDLADAKIGTHITRTEAGNIFELSEKAETLRENFDIETGEWKTPEVKAEYGANKVLLERYVETLKTEELSIKDLLLRRYYEGKQTFAENKAKSVTDLVRDTLNTVADNSVAFKASIDNSFLGRQGINTLKTRPSVWMKAAKKSFTDIYKSLKSKNGNNLAKDILMTDVYSRPNYINGNYEIAKLIPKAEEQFPTTLPERIPVIGRAFSASEAAFTNSAIRMRTELFDILHKIAEENGVDVKNKTEITEIGKVVNSLTARGEGRTTTNPVVKMVLWAPRMLKANWDVLTAHTFGAGLETAFARKQARINLLKLVMIESTVAAIFNAMNPGTVELNPLSSDFMRKKIGDTRFDDSGGRNSIITLIARALTHKSKSTMTGITTELNSGDYGARSTFDVGIDFLVNKTQPITKQIIDVARGRDFKGRKPTAASVAVGLTAPISLENFVENFYGDANALGKDMFNNVVAVLGSITDLVGLSANTYSIREDWYIKDTKEINQFKSEVGKEDFKKANKEYNEIIEKGINETIETSEYKSKSSDDKLKTIKKIKSDAKKEIFKKYVK